QSASLELQPVKLIPRGAQTPLTQIACQSGDVFISHDAFQKARNMRHAFGRGQYGLGGIATDRIGKLRPGGDALRSGKERRATRRVCNGMAQ
ncbi:hypothetical protein J4729_19595, partial [Leisingera sp. HS039]|nr:hypothetical protein [Leisingera sp. HS039]